ncbi:MAG: hypothetical protein RIS94_395 [Pseudomonadota bacterium]|jgi:hypothetical protein
MEEARLPARLEVSALLRRTEAAGGFAVVLRKGEPDAGTILIVMMDNQGLGTLFERMPTASGARKWCQVKRQDIENKQEFEDYLDRRASSDADVWIVELTIADGERLVLNG